MSAAGPHDAGGGPDIAVQFGKEALVVSGGGERVADLKRRLEERTGVFVRRQRLIHKGASGAWRASAVMREARCRARAPSAQAASWRTASYCRRCHPARS